MCLPIIEYQSLPEALKEINLFFENVVQHDAYS